MRETIKAENGAEVYEDQILIYADEYISNELRDPGDIFGNSSLFAGMMKYIYKRLFKPRPGDHILNNTNTRLNLDNIQQIDDIWGIYTGLCYKYKKRPTLLNFGLMVGVDRDTVQSWINGEYRGGPSAPHSATAKRWKHECESALFDGAIEQNSIGCLFALKANHGYTETPQRVEIVGRQAPQLSAEEVHQIAAQASGPSAAELLEQLPDD